MLSADDNELISRVGPGTVMGGFMRQYWIPAMLSSELPSPDCDPVRVLLLGEKLVGFRDSKGNVGLIANACPHRGASLWFGRNEECGLRCVYHGWKFDVEGHCVDMPNEPAETSASASLKASFKHKIKAVAYPCRERGGVIWTYMGPRETPPPLPDIEGNMVEGAIATATQMETNYLAVAEGAIDTSHAGFLHFGSLKAEDQEPGSFSEYMLRDRAPRYAVVDTDGGTMYGAYRDIRAGRRYWRIAHFLLPFYTMNPNGVLGAGPQGTMARVPMDDTHTLAIGFYAPNLSPGARQRAGSPQTLPNSTDWYGRFRPAANMGNDFLMDRELQRRNEGPDGWTGIAGVNRQDQAVQASMGAICDRTKEQLGTSDVMIIRTRRRLLEAAKAFGHTGGSPPGVDDPEVYRMRSGGVVLPDDVDWVEATEDLRRAFVDHGNLDLAVTGKIT
ncbi:MAG: Rieske 2Fe-2S domain-containing protein [Chloroflexota bacterium]|nr:Rieske 2Fe-2S domain-containing protein [Chloroflexota bacterium]